MTTPSSRLREGDVLLLRGARVASAGIACFSEGWSHAGVVLDLGGGDGLCLCHASPNPARVRDVIAGVPFGGVLLTRLVDMLSTGFYHEGAAYRPVDPAARRALRERVVALWGAPYETDCVALACVALKCGAVEASDHPFCPALVAARPDRGVAPRTAAPGDLAHAPGLRLVGEVHLPPTRWWRFLLNFRSSASLPKGARTRGRSAVRDRLLRVERRASKMAPPGQRSTRRA